MILIEANDLCIETVKIQASRLPPLTDKPGFTLDEMNRSFSWNKQRLVQGTSSYKREF